MNTDNGFDKWLEEESIKKGYSNISFFDVWQASATWQREQLDKYKAKDLLDEIHTSYMRYHAENYDTKDFVINLACGSVVVMDKQGYQELKEEREQLEAEIASLCLYGNKDRKATVGILLQQEKDRLEYNKMLKQEISYLQAENKTIREQLINQIKEWAVNNKKDSTKIGELILNGIGFVKFLDLLEKGGE